MERSLVEIYNGLGESCYHPVQSRTIQKYWLFRKIVKFMTTYCRISRDYNLIKLFNCNPTN